MPKPVPSQPITTAVFNKAVDQAGLRKETRLSKGYRAIVPMIFLVPMAALAFELWLGVNKPAAAQFVPSDPTSPEDPVGTTVVRADGYVPPDGGSAPSGGTTGSTGVRGGGCSAATTDGLVLLAPQSHIGQTTSTQPTFMWFTSERDPYRVEFTLAQYLNDDAIANPDYRELAITYRTDFILTEQTQSSGVASFSLSETDVQLVPGTSYIWQVVIVCEPNRPSLSLVAEANMTVVDAPDGLETTLLEGADEATAAASVGVYAQAGLWYDALAATLGLTDEVPTQVNLLQDLVAVETIQAADGMDSPGAGSSEPDQPETENSGTSYSDLLQQVIDRMSQ